MHTDGHGHSIVGIRRHLLGAFAAALASLGVSCAPALAPFTQLTPAPGAHANANAQADASEATLVVLWPSLGCDPGGYYTLATTAGLFLGNVSAGTQLRTQLPAGDHTVVGWNALQEEARGELSAGPVPVLHARLQPGRTYYVRMAFGEWDDRGPPDDFPVGRIPRRGCISPGLVMTSALLTLTRSSTEWNELPSWTEKLAATVPDRAAGQAWLDGHPDALEAHRELAALRFEGLLPQARRMATVDADDGVATSR